MPASTPMAIDPRDSSSGFRPHDSVIPKGSRVAALILSIVLGVIPTLSAAETLLRYVPANAGLIVRVNDWRGHAPQVLASPFWAKLSQNPSWKILANTRDFRNLVKFQTSLEATYGASLETFARDVYGQEAILALFSGEGENIPPWGLLLTRGENAVTVAKGVSAWKRADPHFSENRIYKQISYQVCKPQKAKHSSEQDLLCYVVLNDVMVASGSEEAIRKAIDIHTTAGKRSDALTYKSILETDEYRWNQSQHAPDSFLTVYFQPRQWDRTVHESLFGNEDQKSAPDFTRSLLQTAWKNCRAVSIGVQAERGLTADLALHLSDEARKWWDRIPGGKPFSKSLDQIPREAVVAVGGRVPGSVLSPLLAGILSHQDGKNAHAREFLKGLLQGLDPFQDILPALGPEWTASYFHASPLVDASKSYSQYLLKTQFTDRDFQLNAQTSTTLRQSLANAARTGLHMHALMGSQGEGAATVSTESANGIENLWWLQTPQRHRWSVGMTANSLWLASDPELIRRERATTSADSISQCPNFQQSLGKHHPSGDLFFWADLHQWQENDARRLQKGGGRPNKWLILDPFQTLWLTLSHGEGAVKLGVGLQ